MSVALNLQSIVVGGITTGLRKLDSMGKRDLKNTMKAFFLKKNLVMAEIFHISFWVSRKNLTNDVISTLMLGGNHRWFQN